MPSIMFVSDADTGACASRSHAVRYSRAVILNNVKDLGTYRRDRSRLLF
jgi:hypothetical protein